MAVADLAAAASAVAFDVRSSKSESREDIKGPEPVRNRRSLLRQPFEVLSR